MKTLRNENGIALVTSLLLTLIALGIIMAILYLITLGTQVSGAHRRYKSALEASYGGAEIFSMQILPQVFTNNTTGGLAAKFASIYLQPGNSGCFKSKLANPTAQWGGVCGPGSATLDATSLPDMTFTLQGSGSQANFKVFTKIVDTVPGNSDTSGIDLLSGSGVTGMNSGLSPMHIPAMYRIEVHGERATNPLEKANLTVLYAY
jgi:hypothetical protein